MEARVTGKAAFVLLQNSPWAYPGKDTVATEHKPTEAELWLAVLYASHVLLLKYCNVYTWAVENFLKSYFK